ncbi:DNA starvation/stationary phase protection protein [Brumimicrobium salinarum]|uniref:DNA starvation/stationary phase protection protein n=1 Tax=Brumimicrobium salinarum TaxID=2058658 RepID=A0A2I0R0J7_9FLAO|nr:DNA starvation/stationary phase protection protein [Brumimicrobium salinarum]PKR80116.1 DNA starvation/stationary phase protection protein [Brumimicrobium salinarum]
MKTFKNLGFESEESEKVVNHLNLLLANLHVHYQKLRNYHWNITGGEFFDIHETTEAEYTEVVGEIDEIAERIRVFGATPYSTMAKYLEVSEIEETGTDLNAKEIVSEILKDYEILFSFMVDTIETAREIGDISTDDLVTGFMRRREKMHWMLTSYNAEEK